MAGATVREKLAELAEELPDIERQTGMSALREESVGRQTGMSVLRECAPWIGIVPMRIQLFDQYYRCLDSVCRERKFLTMSMAPPVEMSRRFVESILDDGLPMVVAIVPGPVVVGWCDIYSPGLPGDEGQDHVGRLGLAVRSDFRGRGIGPILLERALRTARLRRLERVELEVFGSNLTAIGLYRMFEFEEEGLKRRARKMAGVYEDILMMAKHF